MEEVVGVDQRLQAMVKALSASQQRSYQRIESSGANDLSGQGSTVEL